MPRDSRPCVICGGGDDQGLVLLCDDCDKPVHAHCVRFTGTLGNRWSCAECEDQAAASEGHESEDESEAEDASVAAGA